jgi:hypothetical protein
MSLAGLGSVSDYLSHNLAAPLMVVRPAAAPQEGGGTPARGGKAAAKVGDARGAWEEPQDEPHVAVTPAAKRRPCS